MTRSNQRFVVGDRRSAGVLAGVRVDRERGELDAVDSRVRGASIPPPARNVLAAVLLGIAAFAVVWLLLALARHGVFYLKAVTAVAFVIPAIWLLDLVLRKRWFVLVHTRRGTRKLLFKQAKDEAALYSFVASVRSRFGL